MTLLLRRTCGGGGGSSGAIYQAVWAASTDFDEVLISPTMINDHMPDNVLDALKKVSSGGGSSCYQRMFGSREAKKRMLLSGVHTIALCYRFAHLFAESFSFD